MLSILPMRYWTRLQMPSSHPMAPRRWRRNSTCAVGRYRLARLGLRWHRPHLHARRPLHERRVSRKAEPVEVPHLDLRIPVAPPAKIGVEPPLEAAHPVEAGVTGPSRQMVVIWHPQYLVCLSMKRFDSLTSWRSTSPLIHRWENTTHRARVW